MCPACLAGAALMIGSVGITVAWNSPSSFILRLIHGCRTPVLNMISPVGWSRKFRAINPVCQLEKSWNTP